MAKKLTGPTSLLSLYPQLVPAQFFLSEVRTKCYIRTAIQNSLSTAPANSKAKAQIQALNMLSSRIRDYTASHSCSVVTSSWIAAKAIPSVGKRRPALASAPASQKALPAPPISSKTDETQVPTPEKPEVASAAMDAPSNPTPPTVPETVITPASPASTASPKAKPFKKHGHFQKSPRLSARKDKRLKEKKEKKVQLQEKAKSEGSLKRISTTEVSFFSLILVWLAYLSRSFITVSFGSYSYAPRSSEEAKAPPRRSFSRRSPLKKRSPVTPKSLVIQSLLLDPRKSPQIPLGLVMQTTDLKMLRSRVWNFLLVLTLPLLN